MMVLHLVKGPAEEVLELNDDNSICLHGCKIILHLLCTWASTRWQIICADRYFLICSDAIVFQVVLFNSSVPESLPQRNQDAESWGSVGIDLAQLMIVNYLHLYIVIAIGTMLSQHVLILQVAILFSMFGCGRCSQLKCMKNQSIN
jgi:hypothetical protein